MDSAGPDAEMLTTHDERSCACLKYHAVCLFFPLLCGPGMQFIVYLVALIEW